jgi:hypothetical protein
MFVNALSADFFSAYCPASWPSLLFLSSLEIVGRNRKSVLCYMKTQHPVKGVSLFPTARVKPFYGFSLFGLLKPELVWLPPSRL